MLVTIFIVATFYPKDTKLSFTFIALFLLLIFSVRFSVPQSDFVNYYGRIKNDWDTILSDFYYGREFIFWYSSKFLYGIVGNEKISYVIFDLLIILSLFLALGKNKKYVPMFYFVFFINIIGVGNIYRQYIVTSICVVILLREPKLHWALFLLTISLFIHNMVVLIIPILASQYGFKRISRLMLATGLLLLSTVVNYKGIDVSGTYMTVFYLFSLIVFTILFLHYTIIDSNTGAIGIISAIGFYCFLPINQAERVIMMILVLYVMLLVDRINIKSNVTKALLALILLVPTMFFPTSYSIINTKSISEG